MSQDIRFWVLTSGPRLNGEEIKKERGNLIIPGLLSPDSVPASNLIAN
jgi:hypothetical protein